MRSHGGFRIGQRYDKKEGKMPCRMRLYIVMQKYGNRRNHRDMEMDTLMMRMGKLENVFGRRVRKVVKYDIDGGADGEYSGAKVK